MTYIGNSGLFVNSGGGGLASAYYYGYSSAAITWSSLTFSAIHNVVTLTDVNQVLITRNNSTFTFAASGIYFFDLRTVGYNTTGNDFLTIRARLSGATIGNAEVYSEAAAARVAQPYLAFPKSLVAGDTVTLEYAVSATYNSFGPTTIDSEPGRSLNLSIFRIGPP